jgi:DNA-directed RNA polymerase specialized sigma subunit
MLRFFAGLTREQVGEVIGISSSAVWREWNFAKAWLLADLESKEASGPIEPA